VVFSRQGQEQWPVPLKLAGESSVSQEDVVEEIGERHRGKGGAVEFAWGEGEVGVGIGRGLGLRGHLKVSVGCTA